MRAHRQEHTYESTQMRAHRWEHRGEHTHESTEEENWSQNREAHFVRACAVETQMDMSQEPFYVEIYRTNAGPQARKRQFVWKFTGEMPDPPVNTSIEHRAFYPYRKNPFSVGTLFGEQFDIMIHEMKSLFSSPWKLLRSIYEQMRWKHWSFGDLLLLQQASMLNIWRTLTLLSHRCKFHLSIKNNTVNKWTTLACENMFGRCCFCLTNYMVHHF